MIMIDTIPEPCALCGDVTIERIDPFGAYCCGHCTATIANGGQPAVVMVGCLAARLNRQEKYITELRRTAVESFQTIDEIIRHHDTILRVYEEVMPS